MANVKIEVAEDSDVSKPTKLETTNGSAEPPNYSAHTKIDITESSPELHSNDMNVFRNFRPGVLYKIPQSNLEELQSGKPLERPIRIRRLWPFFVGILVLLAGALLISSKELSSKVG